MVVGGEGSGGWRGSGGGAGVAAAGGGTARVMVGRGGNLGWRGRPRPLIKAGRASVRLGHGAVRSVSFKK